MNTLNKLALITAIAVCGSIPAQAAVVDFESIPIGNCASVGSPLTTQGFTFVDTSGGGLFNCASGVIHEGSSAALIAANRTSSLTMFEEFERPFTLTSFEAGARTTAATAIQITGTKSDSSIVQENFSFSGLNFDSFLLNQMFTDLTSVNFLALGNGGVPQFLIDNIEVSVEFAPVPLPTPAALLLLAITSLTIWPRLRSARPV